MHVVLYNYSDYNYNCVWFFSCRKLPTEEDTSDVAKRSRYQGYTNSEVPDEEDLMNQYKTGDSPDEAPPTGSGVLSGHSVSVSRRIAAKERRQSVELIREQGGMYVRGTH